MVFLVLCIVVVQHCITCRKGIISEIVVMKTRASLNPVRHVITTPLWHGIANIMFLVYDIVPRHLRCIPPDKSERSSSLYHPLHPPFLDFYRFPPPPHDRYVYHDRASLSIESRPRRSVLDDTIAHLASYRR